MMEQKLLLKFFICAVNKKETFFFFNASENSF